MAPSWRFPAFAMFLSCESARPHKLHEAGESESVPVCNSTDDDRIVTDDDWIVSWAEEPKVNKCILGWSPQATECSFYATKLWPSATGINTTPKTISNKKYPQGCSWDGKKLRYNEKKRGNKRGARAICIKNLLLDAKRAFKVVTKLRADSCSAEDQKCLPAMCVSSKLTRAAWNRSFDIAREADYLISPAIRAETEGYTGNVTSASMKDGNKIKSRSLSSVFSDMMKYPQLESSLLSDASNFGYARAGTVPWTGHATYFGWLR